MPIAYWCVLIAAMLPFGFTAIAKSLGRRTFNNRTPREFQSRLTGAAARAHWAHLNSFEAFPPFAAGVLIAASMHVAQGRIDLLAIAFVVLRVVYAICYIADVATIRSLVWALALLCTIGLYLSAAGIV